MKLEIDHQLTSIKAYEYRDRLDLTEVIIPDSIETIGEGAFKHCTQLQKITVGRGLKHISTFAFDGIQKNADIIWLNRLSYKSKLITILPPFERIRSLCAPFHSFDKAQSHEKCVLACGYILHPELENEYSQVLQKQYLSYIQEELPHHFNELCEKGSILEIFLLCRQRHLIHDQNTMKQLIAYVRTQKITKEEKRLIDQIEQEEHLLQQEHTEDHTIDKKLLRYINDHVSQSELRQVMEKEGLNEFPPVRYKESLRNAPVEALKYIMYRYMTQWSYMNTQPPFFHYDESADKVAQLLDLSSLQSALEKQSYVFIEYFTWGKHVTILYPRRFIPFLRYASQQQILSLIKKSQDWLNYDVYGQEGVTAISTLEHAILLNDDHYAMLYANRHQLLNQYASLRHQREEDLLVFLIDLLENKVIDSDEDLKRIEDDYKNKLYLDYLSGQEMTYKDWYQWNMTHQTLKQIAMTLVWQKDDESYFLITPQGMIDENNQKVSIDNDSFIRVAHPVLMSDGQIHSFQNYFLHHHIQQCFHQIKTMKSRFVPNIWESWKNRYFGIHVPASHLQRLGQHGFHLDGRPAEYMRISFCGKVMMDVFPISHQQERDPIMSLGVLQNSNYNIRELNEAIAIMDDVLFFEMILYGRLDVGPYLTRLNNDEVEQLFNASIEIKHYENTAALLEYKSQLAKAEDDFSLDW